MLTTRRVSNNACFRSGTSSTHLIARQTARILVKAGANLENTTDQLFTALLVAAFNGQLELARCLVAAGAHVEARNKQHYTALCVAAQQGHADILGFLMDRYTCSSSPR